ncbi:MAG: T9SS type A sorting domain-containing protein [Bacteroidota bacterium]|nr:T9SS type A sorting domain-containing protein [Bacteroidota bacterium]
MEKIIICLILFLSIKLSAQNEPWKRPLKICRSIDGVNFSNIQTFQDSAGVPSVIKLSSGVLMSAFQWFRQPVGSLTWDRVAVKFSSDNGINWSEPQPIIVSGLPANFARPFDPTPVITDSNKIRIFFSSGLNMVLDTSINTYSAISDDGINYTIEQGIRFSMPDRPVIDPAVIKFRNLWHLANPFTNMASGGAFHNISNEGINFTRVQDIVSDISHSWIGNYMIKDTNELRFYGSGMMVWYSSSPNGGAWSNFENTNIMGGDPSVLKISDANYIMIYTGQPYPVSVSENINNVKDFSLHQNYPNPFNPKTIINYELGFTNFVILKVYDVFGNEAAVLVNEKKNPGNYKIEFEAANLPSGIYFYSLKVGGDTKDSKRMVLLK